MEDLSAEVERLKQELRRQTADLEEVREQLEASQGELETARAKLAAGDEGFRRFSDSGMIGVAVFKIAGRLITLNDVLRRLLAVEPGSLESGEMQWEQFTPPEWRDQAARVMDELRTHGSCTPLEQQFLRQDGRRFWGLLLAISSDGENVVAFVLDITARRQIEDALRASENRFRTMFDQSPLAIQVFLPNGVSIATNPAWNMLWGVAPEDALGYNILQDEAARRNRSIEQIERAFHGETVVLPAVYLNPTTAGRKGRPRWVESSLYPVKDEAGSLKEVVMILNDITARTLNDQERSNLLGREQEARAHAEAGRRRLEFLAEASRILSSSLDYQTTLDRVAKLAVPVLADWCDIQVLNEAGEIRRVAVAHRDPSKVILAEELARRYPPDPNSTRGVSMVLRTGQPEIYTEIPDELLVQGAHDPEHLRIARELELRSAVIMPLKSQDRVLGAITLVYAESDRRYGAEDIALAEDLARRAGAAIDNARLFGEARKAIERHQILEQKLTLLTEATGTLLESLSLEHVLVEIMRLSHRLVTADAYALWLTESETGDWRVAAAEGLSIGFLNDVTAEINAAHVPMVAPLIAEDTETAASLVRYQDILRREDIGALLAMPLSTGSEFSGTLVFYYRAPQHIDEIELKVSSALANLASSAIATTGLYEALSRRAEELTEADRLKDEFLAMLGHELRNPLGAISNAVQVLYDAELGSTAFSRSKNVLRRQSQHVSRLVDELLDVSRISRGKIAIHTERLDLVGLVHAVCEDYRRTLERSGLSFSMELPDEPLWVDGDPTRLRQAIGNLLQNAAKFTEPGGRVTAGVTSRHESRKRPRRDHESSAPRESNSGMAVVSVCDSGIGIPPDLLPRLFEPFVQADHSLDRTQGGLGLGLALVKSIVTLHHGRVDVVSKGIGSGATFLLEIPLQEEPMSAAEPLTKDHAQTDPIRVLLIEDNRDAAETLRDVLELRGHRVVLAASGSEGLEIARRFQPAVVLCDLGLPGMSGYEVAAALRSDPATAICRLIAVTGYGQEADIRRSEAAGFERHLTKPIDLDQLNQILAAPSPEN